MSWRDLSTKVFLLVSRWTENVQFWVLPGTCCLCLKCSGRRFDLCEACEQHLPRIVAPCEACGLPLPADAPPGLVCGSCLSASWRPVRTVAGFAYRAPVDSLIAAYKYHGALQQGRVLGDLLARRVADAYSGLPLPDLILPVPLYPSRLRERGFNQSLELARQLGRGLRMPVATDLVHRTRLTPSQQGLNARQRRRNLRGAFVLNPSPRFAGVQSVALVDDVVTTMSTVRELARVLRLQHPELAIHAWCVARA